eukprot:gene17796-biopygen12912
MCFCKPWITSAAICAFASPCVQVWQYVLLRCKLSGDTAEYVLLRCTMQGTSCTFARGPKRRAPQKAISGPFGSSSRSDTTPLW